VAALIHLACQAFIVGLPEEEIQPGLLANFAMGGFNGFNPAKKDRSEKIPKISSQLHNLSFLGVVIYSIP
jgi:hypothetical protein